MSIKSSLTMLLQKKSRMQQNTSNKVRNKRTNGIILTEQLDSMIQCFQQVKLILRNSSGQLHFSTVTQLGELTIPTDIVSPMPVISSSVPSSQLFRGLGTLGVESSSDMYVGHNPRLTITRRSLCHFICRTPPRFASILCVWWNRSEARVLDPG